ncbi:MAG: hypothetical protein D3903_12800 [Candidatus Electrothrix sp. GM3_4]|nr:hypothetical protein [Candidatus Electrothrix sp. GM3_4]
MEKVTGDVRTYLKYLELNSFANSNDFKTTIDQQRAGLVDSIIDHLIIKRIDLIRDEVKALVLNLVTTNIDYHGAEL